MRFPPPEVTATWPEPTYINPERRGDANMIVQIILVTIATAFVAIRIYARLVITRARIGLDDGIIIISWVFAVGLTAGVILTLRNYGWDLHIWDLPPQDSISGRKVSWASMAMYAMSAALTKVSILTFTYEF